jgi:hypothetical protein
VAVVGRCCFQISTSTKLYLDFQCCPIIDDPLTARIGKNISTTADRLALRFKPYLIFLLSLTFGPPRTGSSQNDTAYTGLLENTKTSSPGFVRSSSELVLAS